MATSTSGRQLFLSPHDLAQRVACRICGADLGTPCSDEGEVRDDPHHSRWIQYQRLIRERPFTGTVRSTRDGFTEGEVLVVVSSADGHLEVLSAAPSGVTRSNHIPAWWVYFQAFVDEAAGRTALRQAGRRSRVRYPL